jgi:hypothetical protein
MLHGAAPAPHAAQKELPLDTVWGTTGDALIFTKISRV